MACHAKCPELPRIDWRKRHLRDIRFAAKLSLVWGVIPTVVRKAKDIDDVLDIAAEAALTLEVVGKGDLVIVTAGVRTGVSGTTNMLKVHRV